MECIGYACTNLLKIMIIKKKNPLLDGRGIFKIDKVGL
jgi:hypothetical protein